MGIYALANPDKPAWIGMSSDKMSLYPTQEAAEADKAVNAIDIHARYVTWFMWGFITIFAPFAMGALVSLGSLIHSVLGMVLSFSLGCGICWSTLFWLIMGAVWRFDDYGKFAAGALVPSGTSEDDWHAKTHEPDSLYQTGSGMFMKIYYVVLLVLLLLPIAICCVMCCCVCVGGPDLKSKFESMSSNEKKEEDEKEKEPLVKEGEANQADDDVVVEGEGAEEESKL